MKDKNQSRGRAIGTILIAVFLLHGCEHQSQTPTVSKSVSSPSTSVGLVNSAAVPSLRPNQTPSTQAISGTEWVINANVRMKIPTGMTSSESLQCVFAHNAYQNGGDLYEATGSRASISQAWDRLASDLKCAQMLYGVKESAGSKRADGGQRLANEINQHLAQFAEMANRPELVHAPLILTGLSAAGNRALWIANVIPDRVIAVVPYHGYNGTQVFVNTVMSQRSRMHEIPVLYVMAANDPTRVPGIQGINETVRNNGGLWTSVIQPNTGHANMGDQTFIVNWLRKVVAQRVIQGSSLATLSEHTFVGTYTLASLPNGNYYFRDPQIFRAAQYSGSLSKSVWLPSLEIANEWLSYSQSGKN